MTIDIDKLEALAKAADCVPCVPDAFLMRKDREACDVFQDAASPATILALIAEVRALRAYREMAQMQVYELMGVEADVEQGHGFDNTCLETIKRVMGELAAKEPK